jgi:hypothetical protein
MAAFQSEKCLSAEGKLDAKYPAIIDKCMKTLQVLLPENIVGIV